MVTGMGKMRQGDTATDDMILFIILNICSVQFLPTGVMTVLAQAGMSDPSRVILPSILATSIMAGVGILCCRVCVKWVAYHG